ncbi:hypothetical protein SAVCW2_17830 [Streptomyces avermitilis]|uniref:Uncharacterized protein n=1 Tax=Streptomyces avermitilis TaxID=33903 RepID=A0A499VX43_STRAX|nr:hypothetical protein SAVMC3_69000 [Streptomyces avermitilis]GDY82584.1 hypothetical protein SAVCW2_17830 [Streptomyces avermitilis]
MLTADDPHGPLLPQLLAGLLRGLVGHHVPPAVAAGQAQHAAGRDGRTVVSLEAVVEFGGGRGPLAGAVEGGDAVRPGSQRDTAEVAELLGARGELAGGRGDGRLGREERGPVPVQHRRGPPVEHPLHLGRRGVPRGPATAADQGGKQQQTARQHP